MLHEFGDEDWACFRNKVSRIAGVRLADYKPDQMRRRVGTMAQRAGAESFSGYLALIERDPKELAVFREKITINVSELFRNPERFEDLRGFVAQALPCGSPAPLCVWSAGCSHGAEAYSLAILFDEMRITQARFFATDIDESVLSRARSGRFYETDLENLSPERRDAYFRKAGEGEWVISERLRDRVAFEEHDLLASPYPREAYDLIVCRNVVIYFTDDAKNRVYRGLLSALKPGGILFIGSTERIADHRAIGFDLMMPFFYKKPVCAGARSALANAAPAAERKAA